MDAGKLPDEAAMGKMGSALRSNFSFSGRATIDLFIGSDEAPETVVADELIYSLSRPAQNEVKATLSIGTELTDEFLAEVERVNAQIDAYNRTNVHWVQHKNPALLPVENVQLEKSSLSVPAGKTVSESIRLTLSNKDLDTETIYLLPIVVEQAAVGNDAAPKRRVLQYLVNVRPKELKWENGWYPEQEVTMDEEFLTVFYVNTETYQPLIADIYMYAKISMLTWETEKSCSFGNIVNLKPATVEYDAAAGRALFSPGSDLRYVLEQAGKYIRPLQNRGREVCITIENGGKGIGFCNMTDVQIADFVRQVKDVIELYSLDGVNLWDEGSKYGKEGMPPVNTTSYPRLIKALREALPGKLVTLVDKGEPTEYFYDVDKCGGIKVGEYIDYAWHGYADEKEHIQLIDPWASDHPYSEYTRKPIAGLTPEQYGSVNYPRYGDLGGEMNDGSFNRVLQWKSAGRKKNDIIVFGFDLTANEQGPYEGEPHLGAFANAFTAVPDKGFFWGEDPWSGEVGAVMGDYLYYPVATDNRYNSGYRLYVKDW